MNENQAVKVIRKAREAARLRNSNAFVMDPNTGSPRTNAISLEPIPRKYMIALNGQAYNARSLAKMIASGITKVPHTRRTLGVNDVHENFFGKTELERIMSKNSLLISDSVGKFMKNAKKEAVGKAEYSSFETINKKLEIGVYFVRGKLRNAFINHPDFELEIDNYKKYWNITDVYTSDIFTLERMLREIQNGSGYPICAVYGSKIGNHNYGQMNNMSTTERNKFIKVMRMVGKLCGE